MDRTDIALSQLLMLNSRTPYRELAKKLGLSVNAVHKRIMAMQEAGVIRAFTARLSLQHVRAVPVLVFGHCERPLGEEAIASLGAHGSIYWVALAGANFVYVGAYLRAISELDQVVSFVKGQTGMLRPTVGILAMASTATSFAPPPSGGTLAPLDLGIIRSLSKDSRKPLTQVAAELHVSAKTVNRRLERLMRTGAVELSIDWYPDVSDDIMTIVHLQLKPPSDNFPAAARMMKEYSPNALLYFLFGNLPGHIALFVWTNSMKELQEIRRRLEADPQVESIMPNVLYSGRTFDTWRDGLLGKTSQKRPERSA